MLQLPSLHGDVFQLLFQSAIRALTDIRTTVERLEPDSAARELWRLSLDLGWVEGCLPDHSLDAFKSAATLAEAHGYAGVIGPLCNVVVAAATLMAAGLASDDAPLSTIAAGSPIVTWTGRVDVSRMPAVVVGDVSGSIGSATLFVVCSPFAGYAVVPVPAGSAGTDGFDITIINGSEPAVTFVPVPTSAGNYLSAVVLDSVAAADRARLPRITGASAIAAVARHDSVGAVVSAAELAGIGRAALELTVEYVQHRVQFGRPIGSFQAVHHHAADMLRDLTAVRLLVAQAASRLDRNLPAEREAWMAKAKAAEAIPALLRTAHQLTGGIGFYRDYPLEGYLRRSIDASAAYGNALEHRRRLARLLRDDPVRFRGPDAHAG